MNILPPVQIDEAAEFLKAQVARTWGEQEVGPLEDDIRLVAEAMAQVSAVRLPRTVEPLFV